jgi:hypothetical protein
MEAHRIGRSFSFVLKMGIARGRAGVHRVRLRGGVGGAAPLPAAPCVVAGHGPCCGCTGWAGAERPAGGGAEPPAGARGRKALLEDKVPRRAGP